MFRHADGVYLCLVCILCQFSMLHSAWLAVCLGWSRMQEAYSRAGLMPAL